MRKIDNDSQGLKDDADRLYMTRKGDRGFVSIEVYMDPVTHGFKECTKKLLGLITAANKNNQKKRVGEL